MNQNTTTFLLTILGLLFYAQLNAQSLQTTVHHVCPPNVSGGVTIVLDDVITQDYEFPYQLEIENLTNGDYFQYSINQNEKTIENLVAGTYELILNLDDQCIIEDHFDIYSLSCSIYSEKEDATCTKGGKIQIDIECDQSGNWPFTYSWDDGVTWKNRTNLLPGEYCLSATDAYGCQHVKCFVIEGIAELEASISNFENNQECGDVAYCTGEIQTTIVSGNGGYTYQWSNGATSKDINELCEGTYTVTITDEMGCQVILSQEICCCTNIIIDGWDDYEYLGDCYAAGENLPIEINGQVNLDLQYPYITTDVSGGTGNYHYSWSGPNNYQKLGVDAITGLLLEGEYCVTVNDGCQRSVECYTVLFCDNMDLVSFEATLPCPGSSNGSIVANIPEGFNIQSIIWNNGGSENRIENLFPGEYCVTITTISCEMSDCVTIEEETEFDSGQSSFVVNDVITIDGDDFPVSILFCVDEVLCQNEVINATSYRADQNIGFNGAGCFGIQSCPNGTVVNTGVVGLPINSSTQGIVWQFDLLPQGGACNFMLDCPLDNAGFVVSETSTPICTNSQNIGGGLCQYTFNCCKRIWRLWPFWWNDVCQTFVEVYNCGIVNCENSDAIGEDPNGIISISDDEGNHSYLVSGQTVPTNQAFIKEFDQSLELKSETIFEGDNSFQVLKSNAINYSHQIFGFTTDRSNPLFSEISSMSSSAKDGFVIWYSENQIAKIKYFSGINDQVVISATHLNDSEQYAVIGNFSEELIVNNSLIASSSTASDQMFLFNENLLDQWVIVSGSGTYGKGIVSTFDSYIVWGTYENELVLDGINYLTNSGTHKFVASIDNQGDVNWVRNVDAQDLKLVVDGNELLLFTAENSNNAIYIGDYTIQNASKFVQKSRINIQNAALIESQTILESDDEVMLSSILQEEERIILIGATKGNYSHSFAQGNLAGSTIGNSRDVWIYESDTESIQFSGWQNDEIGKALTIFNDEIVYTGHFFDETMIGNTSQSGFEDLPNLFLARLNQAAPKLHESVVNVYSDKQKNDFNVNLFPNPTNNLINIIVKGELEGKQGMFRIFNNQGVTIRHQKLAFESNIHRSTYSLTDLASGLYILQVNVGSQTNYFKVLRQ